MNVKRTLMSVLGLAALLGAVLFASPGEAASAWPTKPIRIVVPFAPGGSNDVIARQLAERFTRSLGQPVVVENRAGGGSSVGSAAVAASAPDGYTLLFVSGSIATTAAVQKTPYDPLKAFDSISLVASAPFVIITREGFPAKTTPELVAYAKANPGRINFGSAGLGDSSQMATELFNNIVGTKMTAINYKGIAPAQLDVVGGRIDLVITTMASIRGTVADKLPKIAFTSAQRDPDFSDVPTVRESGIDYVVDVWWGLFAPAGLPADVRDRLNREVAAACAAPEFATFLKSVGARPAASTPQVLHELLAKDVVRWTDTARRAGIQPQ